MNTPRPEHTHARTHSLSVCSEVREARAGMWEASRADPCSPYRPRWPRRGRVDRAWRRSGIGPGQSHRSWGGQEERFVRDKSADCPQKCGLPSKVWVGGRAGGGVVAGLKGVWWRGGVVWGEMGSTEPLQRATEASIKQGCWMAVVVAGGGVASRCLWHAGAARR